MIDSSTLLTTSAHAMDCHDYDVRESQCEHGEWSLLTHGEGMFSAKRPSTQ